MSTWSERGGPSGRGPVPLRAASRAPAPEAVPGDPSEGTVATRGFSRLDNAEARRFNSCIHGNGTNMWAQVIQGGTTPEQRDEMDRLVREELIPALEKEPGFVGSLNLEDRENGHGMMIMVWETREQAAAPPPLWGDDFRKAVADIMAISTGERAPAAIWEVNALAMGAQGDH